MIRDMCYEICAAAWLELSLVLDAMAHISSISASDMINTISDERSAKSGHMDRHTDVAGSGGADFISSDLPRGHLSS